MDELEKGLEISVKGPIRDEAIAAFEKQIAEWNLVMPPVERMVVDFGLGEFYKTGEIECWIANEVKEGYCGKFLFVFDGQTCPMHMHKTKHETFYIVRGRVRMKFGGGEKIMNAGDVLPVPCGKLHSFTGVGPALLLEVSKPCIVDDNYFENTAIPIGGNYKGNQGKDRR
jgi:mannose-6-phosphate isomerase-like protein (cupin superfamily)